VLLHRISDTRAPVAPLKRTMDTANIANKSERLEPLRVLASGISLKMHWRPHVFFNTLSVQPRIAPHPCYECSISVVCGGMFFWIDRRRVMLSVAAARGFNVRFCPQCGAPRVAAAQFCVECGGRLDAPESVLTVSELTSPPASTAGERSPIPLRSA